MTLLIQAYDRAYRDLKNAWHKWLVQDRMLQPKKKVIVPPTANDRIKELKERYLSIKEKRRRYV